MAVTAPRSCVLDRTVLLSLNSPTAMVCARCGKTVGSSSAFCDACGTRLTRYVDGSTLPAAAPLKSFGPADAEQTMLATNASRIPDVDDRTMLSGNDAPPSRPVDADDDATRLVAATPAPPSSAYTSKGSAETGPLAAGQAFGSRYHIIRLLGIGGMGAVYQAWDAELGVAVAIKVIRPEVMADPTLAEEI